MTAIAAKALIVNEIGELLFQLRDSRADTLFPNKWDLFGGGVLTAESPEEALERELEEELGIKVTESTLLFKSLGNWDNVMNYVFLVKIRKNQVSEFLGEGQKKSWLAPGSIVTLDSGPLIYRNLFDIGQVLEGYHTNVFVEFEISLLDQIRLRKHSDRVYFAKGWEAAFSIRDIWKLAAVARSRGEMIFRVCAHADQNEDIQEMIICHLQPQVVGPLRQPSGTSISFTTLEGEGVIRLYSQGQDCREVKLSTSDYEGVRTLRIQADQVRAIESTVTPFIFHEVNKGPFQDSDTEWVEVFG